MTEVKRWKTTKVIKYIKSLTIANGRTNLMHPSIVRVKFHRVDSKQVPSWMISVQSRTFTVCRKYLENATIFTRLRFQTRLYWTSPKIEINTGNAPPSFVGAFKIWISNEFHNFHVNMNCATNRRQCLSEFRRSKCEIPFNLFCRF